MQPKFKHIAFADDDNDDKEILQEAIKMTCPDVNFTLADDGLILLDLLKSSPKPDLIILDINMPILGGKECLKVIKSNRSMKEVPVMIYSTSANKADIEETISNGADYYVIKPDSILAINKLAKDICLGDIKDSTG